MAKKVKSLILPALRVFMRTGPTDHSPSQPIMGSDYTMGVRLLRSSLTPCRKLLRHEVRHVIAARDEAGES